MISKLADAAGCQRSYLSRALNSKVQLTPDHVFGISTFWRLDSREAEYLQTLLEFDRASSVHYRTSLAEKLKRLRQANENLQAKVQRPEFLVGDKELTYYSSWHYSALHIIVSIPKFRTIEKIAERLQLDKKLVEDSLGFLEKSGLVVRKGKEYHFNSSEIHVPKSSPLSSLYHSHWRQRAIQDAQRKIEGNIHFSVVQSIDAHAWELIKEKLLHMIEEASAIAAPAKEELLVAVCCDFFEV